MHFFFTLVVETRQNTNHCIDGMALNFFARITKLVDDQVDQLVLHVHLSGIGKQLGCDIERSRLLEFKLCVAHLQKGRRAEFA